MQPNPLISLENITVRLQDRLFLQNTSWRINSNEHWAILGPNGSGKTTLAKSLFGAVPIVRGNIIFHFSKKDRNNPAAIAKAIGYVSPELHRDIIERENLHDTFREFSGKIHEKSTLKDVISNRMMNPAHRAQYEKRLRQVAKKMGIETLLERGIKTLSTGEMNTALIAKALIKRPKLLILDEPFNGLDKQSRHALADIIDDLTREKIQVVLITHRLEEIVSNITHGLLLKQGEIFAAGSKNDVFTHENIHRAYEIENRSNRCFQQKIRHALSGFGRKRPQALSHHNADAPGPLIEMKKVTVKYGQALVLDKFSWIVEAGQNWALVGPKGAGKSTVLALILGDNLQAYANEIYLFGQKRGSGESIWDIKKKIGYISSDLQLRQHRNIDAFDVVCSGFFDSNGLYRRCSSAELAVARRWSQFLDVADLADQRFGRLSHGQRQLILIARAMVKSPKILILDEPFQGLDIKNRARIRDVFEYIGSHTSTNLIYVPDQDEQTLACITHKLGMDRGKVAKTDSVEN